MKIAGKVALITGGTGGLGKAFAKALLNGNAAAVSLHIILQSDLIFMMFSAVIILEFSTSNSEFDCSLVTRDKANLTVIMGCLRNAHPVVKISSSPGVAMSGIKSLDLQ